MSWYRNGRKQKDTLDGTVFEAGTKGDLKSGLLVSSSATSMVLLSLGTGPLDTECIKT